MAELGWWDKSDEPLGQCPAVPDAVRFEKSPAGMAWVVWRGKDGDLYGATGKPEDKRKSSG